MRKLLILFSVVCLFSCHHSVKINGRSLSDTIDALTKQYDFKPMDSADAYAFVNQYYLPRLDTLRTGRTIFIHPLSGIDFKTRYAVEKTKLKRLHFHDSTITKISLPLPPSLASNGEFSWDSKKLQNTSIIPETPIKHYNANDAFDSVKTAAWHRKYGAGYMLISYPQYNANTKRLVVREWVEDHSFCGTGRLTTLWYAKTADGWKADGVRFE